MRNKTVFYIDLVHIFMYSELVKKRDLDNKMKAAGWWLHRQGSGHEIWTNGKIEEPMPRHREIHEILAKKILKKAASNPPSKQ